MFRSGLPVTGLARVYCIYSVLLLCHLFLLLYRYVRGLSVSCVCSSGNKCPAGRVPVAHVCRDVDAVGTEIVSHIHVL
jgi:hypothetical protein